MRLWVDKLWFSALRAVIYSKRAVVWILRRVWLVLAWFFNLSRRTLGFQVYKLGFKIQKYTGRWRIPWDSRLSELLGRRGFLQVAFFLIMLAIIFPQSRYYTANSAEIPGRRTMLYVLVGPGELDFSLEEVSVDFSAVVSQETQTWRQGAVAAQPSLSADNYSVWPSQEISGVISGGGAVAKPTIIPGAVLPAGAGEGTGRRDIIYHLVEPGDTVGALAEKYRISVATILWANNLSSYSLIRPGDKLKILPVSGLAHTVVKNDTLSKIALTYNVQTEAIVSFNRLQAEGSDIKAGEELVIPGGIKPQPVYTPVRTIASFSQVSAPPATAAPSGVGYLWPTSVWRITQYFGWRHTGVDIAGPMGTPVYASRSGRVTKSQCGWNGGYGCYIIIDHGQGVQTLYSHNSRLYVVVGDEVAQGQTIAAMGSTGRSTGPHVHFEVIINGQKVNPLRYVR